VNEGEKERERERERESIKMKRGTLTRLSGLFLFNSLQLHLLK